MTGKSQKPRVHDDLVKTLACKILSGEYPVGSLLPPEPELCATYAISRSALREATRVLAGKGLVAAKPRVGTVIRRRETWNLLDADLLGWSLENDLTPEFAASLVEARQIIEPAAARLAATRADSRDLALIEQAYIGMRDAAAGNDVEAFIAADIDFHTALLKASGNAVFQQLSIAVTTALSYAFHLNARNGRRPGQSLEEHAKVLEHIRMRRPQPAYDALHALLDDVAMSMAASVSAESGAAQRTKPLEAAQK